jgi:hypothetical protein
MNKWLVIGGSITILVILVILVKRSINKRRSDEFNLGEGIIRKLGKVKEKGVYGEKRVKKESKGKKRLVDENGKLIVLKNVRNLKKENKEETKKEKKIENPQVIPENKENKEGKQKLVILSEVDIIGNIENDNLKSIFELLKLKGISFLKEFNKTFASKKDFEKFLIEKMIDYLKSRHEVLKSKMSKLRKKGVSIKILEIEMVSAPYKIKKFKATLDKKDLDKLIDFFEETEKEINELAKTNNVEF